MRGNVTMKFPAPITWGDIFCRASSARDFNWGHILDKNDTCVRCRDYVRSAEVTQKMKELAAPSSPGETP